MMHSLTAISPIDGRYAAQLKDLSAYFSEHALLRARARVEVQYLIALSDAGIVRKLSANEQRQLHALGELTLKDAERIKELESRTAHDVKALEYYFHEKLEGTLKDVAAFVHFALTSEDVNNLAYACTISSFLHEQYLPTIRKLQGTLRAFALQHAELPMLGRTHGQPASPTTVGKEFSIYVSRLHAQFPLPKLQGKLNGAVGNFNAHLVAYPDINWLQFAERFIAALGLHPQLVTTQVLPADALAALFHQLMRINTILLDLCRDVWSYLSRGTFLLQAETQEVGSSTMPHKVNPILFENAEGNIHIANALLGTLASQLPNSRLQRDLVGSTMQRNIGVAFGHTLLAIQNLTTGLDRFQPVPAQLCAELEAHPEVLAEAIHTALRATGTAEGYEKLKELTRGKTITLEQLRVFVQTLSIPDTLKQRLLALTPAQYTGLAAQLCRYAAERAEIR